MLTAACRARSLWRCAAALGTRAVTTVVDTTPARNLLVDSVCDYARHWRLPPALVHTPTSILAHQEKVAWYSRRIKRLVRNKVGGDAGPPGARSKLN